MKLLMISGDRSILHGKLGAFWYTLQELRKYWDRIDVVCPRVRDESVELCESGHRLKKGGGGDVFFHPCPSSLIFQPRWIVLKGGHLLKEHRHNVMTVHDFPPFYNGRGARVLHRKAGIPYALEVHHIVGWPKPASWTEWVGKMLSRYFLPLDAREAEGVRVVNSAVGVKLKEWGIPKNKITNLSSLYLDRDVLSKQHKPPVSYDVAFCGRLVANKGLKEVIHAVKRLPGVRLLIIGDGPERQRMEGLVKSLGINGRVTFLGWLPTQEGVSGAIQTARVFVMNSSSEGGPRVALEAMGCGMPIITTRVGVMPEVVTDGVNGIFTTGTADDLVRKIGMLLQNDGLCEALGRKAMEVLDSYERTVLIRNYADFLKSFAR